MPAPLHPDWKKPRQDRRVSNFWRAYAERHALTEWQALQRDQNYIEAEYGERPSNNGLDPAHPAFAYTTNLAKFIMETA